MLRNSDALESGGSSGRGRSRVSSCSSPGGRSSGGSLICTVRPSAVCSSPGTPLSGRSRLTAMTSGYAAPAHTLRLRMAASDIAYTVRRSDRARRVRITVHPEGEVEVVLPRRAREREAAAAVAELRPWIERRLAEAVALRERLAERGATVPLLGGALALVVEPGRIRAHR